LNCIERLKALLAEIKAEKYDRDEMGANILVLTYAMQIAKEKDEQNAEHYANFMMIAEEATTLIRSQNKPFNSVILKTLIIAIRRMTGVAVAIDKNSPSFQETIRSLQSSIVNMQRDLNILLLNPKCDETQVMNMVVEFDFLKALVAYLAKIEYYSDIRNCIVDVRQLAKKTQKGDKLSPGNVAKISLDMMTLAHAIGKMNTQLSEKNMKEFRKYADKVNAFVENNNKK
jgi:hypothetical protein